MKRTFIFAFCLYVLAQHGSSASAGIETFTGSEAYLWDPGIAYLIVARVTDIEVLKRVPNEDATHILSLEPLFTVAGAFDPSKQPQLRARVAIARHGSYVDDLPSKGSIVLALVRPGNVCGDDSRPFPCVAPEICQFMPDQHGMIILKGADDPLVHETLERIRKERAAGEAEAKAAEKAAQTQPAPDTNPASGEKPK